MGNGLHLTGCDYATRPIQWPCDCRHCRGSAAFNGRHIQLTPAFNPEPWQLGETYMYQEPEPVHLWPESTRWERFRARIKMWYRRWFGMEWRL